MLSLRVAIYSQDGLGLGHLRRNTLIGREILGQTRNSTVLLLADSPVAPFFRLDHGMDHLKLPSIKKVTHGQWEAAGLRISEADLRRLRSNLLRDAILSYHPNLLLVDHMPGGAQGEIVPALASLRHERPECRVILGLRDILDAEDVIARVWEAEGAFDVLRSYYHGILIYGSDQVFDTRHIYHLPAPSQGVHYCGYVVNQGPVQPAGKIREQFRISRRYVFVSAGGGADGRPLLETCVQAVRLLGARADFDVVMAAGANADAESYSSLEEQAQGLPIRLVPFSDDSISHIASSDLVICMAGYNTLSEVLYRRKKALVVPRPGPSAEQRMRAEVFQQRGLIDVLDPADLNPEALADRILNDLDRTDFPLCDETLCMSGAKQAAARLLELV